MVSWYVQSVLAVSQAAADSLCADLDVISADVD